jgi:endonuclease-3
MRLSVPPLRTIVDSCLDDLERLWKNGIVQHPPYSDDPLDGLILTILSQNTNDRNRDRAFSELKARFTSWERVASASQDTVAEAIRTGGIANIKAQRILSVLDRVRSRFGEYSLRKMKHWKTPQIAGFLKGMGGIGPKTIACVLLFDLGRPAFPVDTHVARVSRRLGWASGDMTPEEIQSVMEKVVDEERYLEAHLNMITHGRNICTSRKVFCDECPLPDRCYFARTGEIP